MGARAWENECQISQNDILLLKFSEVTCVLQFLWNLTYIFLGSHWEIVFGVITDNKLYLYPLKNVKRNAVFFKIILVQGFCPLKVEIFQFPDGFRFNLFFILAANLIYALVRDDQCKGSQQS